MRIGLLDLVERAAGAAQAAARGKRGAEETRRRLATALRPLLEEAVLIGLDQGLIAVGFHNTEAMNAIAARRKEIEGAL